jgi:L-lysine 6-transaminase
MLADGMPLVLDIERSRGAHIVDAVSGDTYLDLFGSYATSPLGFNHPGLEDTSFQRELLRPALNKVANSDLYSVEFASFVTTFAEVVPPSLRSHLFFIDGGALAVENALKTAFDWKRRLNLAAGRSEAGGSVLHFRNAFHGRSGYTLSLTNTDPRKTEYFPQFDWPRVSFPSMRFPFDDDARRDVEQAEATTRNEILAAIERLGHDIAALIVEPIQGEGGDNHARGEFLAELRRLADEHEFLLIFDEVQTGFGTTGRWWCCEHFDVVPDVLVFAKKAQVCGIAVSPRVNEVDSVFEISSRINSTWGGHLVDMVRCRRIIEVIRAEKVLDNAAAVGAELLAGLETLSARFPDLAGNARGRGAFLAFDLPGAEQRQQMLAHLFELKLLALPSGEHSIRFRPPMTLTPGDAQVALERLETALGRIA